MRRMLVGMAAFGAGAATLLTGCGGGQETEPTPTLAAYDTMAPITAADRTAVTGAFDLTKRYWVARGAGVQATKLVILEGKNTLVCPDTEGKRDAYVARADNPLDIAFCESLMTVVVSQAGINEMNHFMDQAMQKREERAKQTPDPDEMPGGRPRPIGRKQLRTQWWDIIQAHEFGHDIQHLHGVKTPELSDTDNEARRKFELQADCLTGVTIVKTDPAAFMIRADIYDQLAPGFEFRQDTHGARWDREGYFTNGAVAGAGVCGVPGL